MDAQTLHHDAVVVDCHNDLILLVDYFDGIQRPGHFADFWLPELRAGGVDVQILPIYIEEKFQSEGALRRTLLLVERIHQLAVNHPDDIVVCETGSDVHTAVQDGKIAVIIALEGAHAIGQDAALIDTMFRVGVRCVSMAHLGRTFLADGSGLDETSKAGLTPEGVDVFKRMEQLGIVFDVSHLGLAGVEDVLEMASRPLLATHSACLGITTIHRNLGDMQIKAIAELGGVVGVAAAIPFFIDPANPSAERVVDHIELIAELAGVDHVGLGPDFIDDYYQQVFGGWVVPPSLATEDLVKADISRPSDLHMVTEEMVRRGWIAEDIRKVLGENVLRVLDQVMGISAAPEDALGAAGQLGA